MLKKLAKLLGALVGTVAGLFVLTFTIYFFNLDMKAMTLLEPILFKAYDARKDRDQHL